MSYVLKIPTKISLSSLLNRVEFATLVLLLLYFLGFKLPSPLPKLLNIASYGIIALLISFRARRVLAIGSRNLSILLLVVLAIVSVTWSVNPAETVPVARGLVRTTLIGVYLVARYSFKQQMELWLWVFGLGTVFSFLLGILFAQPSSGWVGGFPQKNYLARVMALSAELFLSTALLYPRIRKMAFAGAFLAGLVLVLSQGKTSLVLFLLMTALLPMGVFLKQHYKLQVFIYSLSLLLVGVVAFLLLSNLELILVDILGKNLELNGRIPVWQLCIDKIQERPWFGYGYGAFWHSPESWYVTSNSWSNKSFLDGVSFNPHHGFIGMALDLGLAGVALMSISFASTFAKVLKILRATGQLECFWMLQFLLFLLIFNLFDNAGLLSGKDALWSLYVSVAYSAAVICEKINQDKAAYRYKAAA